MSIKRLHLVSCVAVCLSAGVAWAGPEHIESQHGDAGSYSSTSQKVYKSYLDPRLDLIGGSLSFTTGGKALDQEDMYLIRITDPVEFTASTDPSDCVLVGDPPTEVCGSSEFDSQLWLMSVSRTEDGFALLANDEKFLMSGSSKLTSQATDGSGRVILEAGEYLIAITAYGNEPQSSAGELFDFATRTEVSGPDGSGARSAHNDWTGGGPAVPGDYVIVFTGAGGFVTRMGAAPSDGPRHRWAIGAGGLVLVMGLSLCGLSLVRSRARR